MEAAPSALLFGYPRKVTSLAQTAAQTVSRHALLPDGAPVLLMVSGGADSVALLHLAAGGAFGERPVRVLHVNHLLRGADSDADEAFVRDLCSDLGVDCRVVRFDVVAFASEEGGLNLEDAGRRVRYRFADEELDAWCEALRVRPEDGRIAVAHTLDDRIETFFMRAVAGSGTGALSSIAHARGRVVRPLLDCERASLRDHLLERGARWREDATNADTEHARALVRAEILPAAERLNPGFRDSMARTMDLLGDDDALLARMASGFADDFTDSSHGEVRFNRNWMTTLERTMARRTVREALARAFPEASRIEATHVEALVDGLAVEGFSRDLPFGLRAFTEYATLVVSHADAEIPRIPPCVLPVPGRADLGAAGEVLAEASDPSDTSGTADSVVIDIGRVRAELTVDSVREGDRMRPLGMDGSRKLSDLVGEAKVPRRRRGLVPVVRDGERIVWLAGVRMSDEYRVTEGTSRAVRLTHRPDEADDDGRGSRQE